MKIRLGKVMLIAVLIAVAITALVCFRVFWSAGRTLFDLLNENRKLRQAVANLTAESQIGYAKVLSQETRDGRLVTRVRFVETERDDPRRIVLEKEYDVEGDVVHFDALIVKFAPQYVADGRSRALYLWRRVYGEKMKPEDGFPIETPGSELLRYSAISNALSRRDRALFWTEIWKLSNDPLRLQDAGITAVYGNDLYQQLKPGLIYLFRIGNNGQFYLETAPEM